MNKFKHRSKVGVAVAAILMTIGSVAPAFAGVVGVGNTVVENPVITDPNAATNNIDVKSVGNSGFGSHLNLVDSSTNIFGVSGIPSDYNDLTRSNGNIIRSLVTSTGTDTGSVNNKNVLIDSDTNTIDGRSNIMTNSTKNKIQGNANELNASASNTITGNTNKLTKTDSNTITGNANTINTVTDALRSASNTITGNNNLITDSKSNTITGDSNVFLRSNSSTITGNNVHITDGNFAAVVGNGVIIGNTGGNATDKASALGNNAVVSAANSVALGADSIADKVNTVSVGSVGKERQITNVADGTTNTDAVNLGQLNNIILNSGTSGGGIASGTNSTAYGVDSRAAGANSTAFGPQSKASAIASTAYGANSTASGIASTAIGANSLASGNAGTAYGTDSVASGAGSTATGANSQAIGSHSAAYGVDSVANGANSVALGSNSIANRDNTVSVGGRQITDVANGTERNDALNVGQWMDGTANTEGKIYRTGALAAALTGIMPLAYDPNARTQVGVGVGGYHGENAVAIGVNHYINESLLVNAGMSADGSDRMYRGGLTWRLGQSTKKVETTEMGNLRSQLQQQQSELQQLKQQMAALISATGQTSVVEQSPVQAIVIQDVLFAFDKDTLQQQAYPILDKVVSTVKNNPSWNYVLVGHTDSKGTDAYNMDLSLRRVKTVQNYLISQGVPANLLSIQKDGELQPKETNATAEGRAENRRVEIHIN